MIAFLAAMALIVLTSGTSFPAAASAGGDDDLKGMPPSPPAEWHYFGIGNEESDRWIAAGIIFAGWAAQWRDEGFSPEAAGKWRAIANVYTAGDFLKNGFGYDEAKEWMAQGIQSGIRAREYLSGGLGPGDAAAFWKDGIYPDTAAAWWNAGFDAKATRQWHYGTREAPFYFTADSPSGSTLYALDQMRKWRDAGCGPEDAHASGRYRIDLDEATAWRDAGFTFREAAAWKDSGFSIADAAAWKKEGIGHADADRRRYDASTEQGDEIAELAVDLTLDTDGTLGVIETIDLIDRPGGMYTQGFYLDLPRREQIRSLRSFGYSRTTYAAPSFRVRSAEIDGAPAAYAIEGGMLRLNVPAAQAGKPHRIVLSYMTDDRVVREPQHDVLAFTVIADNPPGRYVRHAAAVIRLPKGADVIYADGRAGLEGRKDLIWEIEETAGGDIVRVEATRPLREKMGFTVNVGFVQGIVNEGLFMRFIQLDRYAARLLSSLFVFLSGLALTALLYLIAWHRVGRDPKAPAADMRAGPPDGIRPSSMRQIATGKRDHLGVAAELLALAEGGFITIRERDNSYLLERTGADPGGLPPAVRAFCDALFGGEGKTLLPSAGRSRALSSAANALSATLKGERRGYGTTNLRHLLPGVLTAIVTLGISLAVIEYADLESGKAATAALAIGLFQAACFALLTLLFLRLLRAPTREYAELRAQASGYRAYLARTLAGPAGFLPRALQKHLPYAVAAGIDMSCRLIKNHEAEWYRGSSGGFSCGDFIAAVKRSM